MYYKMYINLSKRIIINEIKLINSNSIEKENYKKEIKRLKGLRGYILKKLVILKNYSETDIENFIIWSI